MNPVCALVFSLQSSFCTVHTNTGQLRDTLFCFLGACKVLRIRVCV